VISATFIGQVGDQDDFDLMVGGVECANGATVFSIPNLEA